MVHVIDQYVSSSDERFTMLFTEDPVENHNSANPVHLWKAKTDRELVD